MCLKRGGWEKGAGLSTKVEEEVMQFAREACMV